MGGRGRLGLMLALALSMCGCSQDADRMARVCHKVAGKFDGVTESMRERLQNGWGAVRGSVSESSLDSRVVLRLRWDKDMAGTEVQVTLVGPGVVELRGNVADLTQRTRAVQLARTTTGVENVRDALTLEGAVERP